MSDGEFCAYFVDIIQNRLDKLPIRIFKSSNKFFKFGVKDCTKLLEIEADYIYDMFVEYPKDDDDVFLKGFANFLLEEAIEDFPTSYERDIVNQAAAILLGKSLRRPNRAEQYIEYLLDLRKQGYVKLDKDINQILGYLLRNLPHLFDIDLGVTVVPYIKLRQADYLDLEIDAIDIVYQIKVSPKSTSDNLIISLMFNEGNSWVNTETNRYNTEDGIDLIRNTTKPILWSSHYMKGKGNYDICSKAEAEDKLRSKSSGTVAYYVRDDDMYVLLYGVDWD